MFPRLVAVSGPLSGGAFSLDQSETSIGCDHSNSIALADATVSPRHCILAWNGQQIVVRDFDRSNPTFVNGLPADDRALQHGDRLQMGRSLFVLTFGDVSPAREVRVALETAAPRSMRVMRREDALMGGSRLAHTSAARLARDLVGLMRVNSAINAVRGLVALERPLIELLAEIVPATQGALILATDPDEIPAVERERASGERRQLCVSRPMIERVLRDLVGVMAEAGDSGVPGRTGPPRSRSLLAAPLVAFEEVLGAIYLESDSPDQAFDEGHLSLLMSIAAVAGTALGYERHAEWLASENRRLQNELAGDHNIVGESSAMRAVFQRLARVAPTESTVLVTGESGTGKDLVAYAIHNNSPRADRPFVAINCAAITETLLESELFGYEKGAFTGAVAQKKGRLETAEGGTVFLDEIGELSPALQAKLLRVLQDRGFERVGGTRRVSVDFRLIAATNRNLEEAIAQGAFRRDLYYRLNVVALAMPPLRERPEDIPLLAQYFIRHHAGRVKRRVSGIAPAALACLSKYDWPGNVRELENAIERAVVLGSTDLILLEDLPDAVVDAGAESTTAVPASTSSRFHDVITQSKKDLILRVFEQAGGNYTAAAQLLGLHPNYLHRLIRNLNLKGSLRKQGQ
jgi:two-component system, NtrC family, response regulator HydG